MSVTDDDRGIVFNPTVPDGGGGDADGETYTVKLATSHRESPCHRPVPHRPDRGPTFTTSNWDTAQTVTVNQDRPPTVTLTHTETTRRDITVTVTDDDVLTPTH